MGPASSPLLGTWKLRTFSRVDAETGEKSSPLGTRPRGYINYSPDGRMIAIVLGENRK
jgi:Lipocalin-like domain